VSVPDPYKTLQVDSEAESEVIEAAYRRLARKYHPDVAIGPGAQERMVRINQAWEMLKDPGRRAAVDRARARASATASRVAAADAHAQARANPAPHSPPAAQPTRHWRETRPGTGGAGDADPTPSGRRPMWPFVGVSDDRASPNWTAGRSATGGGYDQRTMGTAQGHGTAGPPPGSPSGSVLNFGRYAGWSLGEIARANLEYLEWLDRMPIGRPYQFEIDGLLRSHGRRTTAPTSAARRRGIFRRR